MKHSLPACCSLLAVTAILLNPVTTTAQQRTSTPDASERLKSHLDLRFGEPIRAEKKREQRELQEGAGKVAVPINQADSLALVDLFNSTKRVRAGSKTTTG